MSSILLAILFSFSFFSTLLAPIFLPGVKLSFFAPLLVTLVYRKNRLKVLVFAMLIGLVFDLLSAHTPIGFWSFNYVVSSFILLHLKAFFFEDKWPSYPLLTLIFSQISTLFYITTYNLFFPKLHLSLLWVMTDLIVYPLLDGAYALCVYWPILYYATKLFPERRKQTKSFRLTKETH